MTGLEERRAALVPELYCSDVKASIDFYTRLLGFTVLYDRPEEGFAYLERQGAELMLEQQSPGWSVGPLEHPYGRGMNLQIRVSSLSPILEALAQEGIALFRPVEDRWYRIAAVEGGNRQVLVQDPDGYLLRFFESLGDRPIGG
ncbi:bleomycin resistance protein [Elioraea rosea]|uniref:bleomycin resistance protein n=1 Tax=Elioraea rosea TaxID=2492390 RepID=UPI001183C29F|nr:VOC family protein [Elioraea rosea]